MLKQLTLTLNEFALAYTALKSSKQTQFLETETAWWGSNHPPNFL